jgi:hypothetical protein
MARYVDRRPKSFQTVLGDLTLERAYYHCPQCQSGFCPRDRALGLDQSLSPGVVRMIGATVGFEEGSGLLKELAGLHVVAKQVERTAESLGAEVAEDERSHVDPVPSSEIAPTLYLSWVWTEPEFRYARRSWKVALANKRMAPPRLVK